MALDEPDNEIKVYKLNEIDVMIGDDILPYTSDSMLDFVNDDRGHGFILGPADGGSCGC